MYNIPLTIKKLHELEDDNDPDIYDKKKIFECLEKNLKFNIINYQLLSMGSHGVVISPSFFIKNNNLIDGFNNLGLNTNDFISKVLNLDNEDEFFIKKEIFISEKLKKLDKKYEYFIYPCSYEKFDTKFYNIIMKKGYDFILNISQLHFNDFITCIYNLVNSIEILSDNDILLLDIKPDNFLFSEIKEHLYKSVIIDFSGELLIENIDDLNNYLNNFKFFCHNFWPIELIILLHHIGLEKHFIEKKKTYKYNKCMICKLGNNITKNTTYELKIYNYLKQELEKISNGIKSDLYQKIMLYQIGRSFELILKKNYIILTDIEQKFLKKILSYITNENYFHRLNIKCFKEILIKYNPNKNSLIKIDKIL